MDKKNKQFFDKTTKLYKELFQDIDDLSILDTNVVPDNISNLSNLSKEEIKFLIRCVKKEKGLIKKRRKLLKKEVRLLEKLIKIKNKRITLIEEKKKIFPLVSEKK